MIDEHKTSAPCPHIHRNGQPCGAGVGERCRNPGTGALSPRPHAARVAVSNAVGRDPLAEWQRIPDYRKAGALLFLEAGYAGRRRDIAVVQQKPGTNTGKGIPEALMDHLSNIGAAERIGTGWRIADFGRAMLAAIKASEEAAQ